MLANRRPCQSDRETAIGPGERQDRVSLHVIVQMADAKGTSFTLKQTTLESVMEEFHNALAEQRLMNIGMERPDYFHRANPHQVSYIHTLDY